MHTPGPWHRNIKPASKYSTIFSGRNTHVARVVTNHLPDSEIEANCDLIAAAPDLFAALRLYVVVCGNTAACVSRESAAELYDIATAALAKAGGQ